jgi:hypothetical protein
MSLINDDNEKQSLHSGRDSISEMGSEISSDSESIHSAQSTEISHRLSDEETLESYYDEVVDIVDKLFDISILIREVSRNFKISRTAAYIEKDEEGNDVLEEFKKIVSLKIKGLCQETPD